VKYFAQFVIVDDNPDKIGTGNHNGEKVFFMAWCLCGNSLTLM